MDALRVTLGASGKHLEDKGRIGKDLQKAKVTRDDVSSVCLLQPCPFAFKVSKAFLSHFSSVLLALPLSLLALAGPFPAQLSSLLFLIVFPFIPHPFSSCSVNLSWHPSEILGVIHGGGGWGAQGSLE